MAIANEQLLTLINRLSEKTRAGTVRWTATVGPNRYETRFGDFAILLQGGMNALEPDMVTIDVTRLSGGHVASATTSRIAMIGRRITVSEEVRSALLSLYGLVDNRSSDLDELLNLIG